MGAIWMSVIAFPRPTGARVSHRVAVMPWFRAGSRWNSAVRWKTSWVGNWRPA